MYRYQQQPNGGVYQIKSRLGKFLRLELFVTCHRFTMPPSLHIRTITAKDDLHALRSLRKRLLPARAI
jgi:hypothetical protein